MFSKATSLVHLWFREHVSVGDVVVDATCGNGLDTLAMARLVGPGGHVYAVDIQKAAIDATRELVSTEGMESRVSLIHGSHAEPIPGLSTDPIVRCVLFNLGYLPGSDKSVTTTSDSTIEAHRRLIELLAPGGVIMTTVYVGHHGGQEEGKALEAWCKELDGKRYSVARHEWVNQEGSPPFILIIQRR